MMIRLARQNVLFRRAPPRYVALIGEAALRQGIGSPEVMTHQRRHLLDVAKVRTLSLRIVPAGCGWHAGLAGPFMVYDFADLPSIVFWNIIAGVRSSMMKGMSRTIRRLRPQCGAWR
jgi:Domain of unknown function (DUF5753)